MTGGGGMGWLLKPPCDTMAVFSLQELMEYICQLEQKMGTAVGAKWSAAPIAYTGDWSPAFITCVPRRCEQ